MESSNKEYPPEYLEILKAFTDHAMVFFDIVDEENGTDMVFNVLQSLVMTYAKKHEMPPEQLQKLLAYTVERYSTIMKQQAD